jgi:uncharacterized repeat protein (TIGR01451 family)
MRFVSAGLTDLSSGSVTDTNSSNERRARRRATPAIRILASLFFVACLGVSAQARAQLVADVALCIDGSSSIGAGDWTIQVTGTANSLDAVLTGREDGTIRVSILPFASGASVAYADVIDSVADRNALVAFVSAMVQPTGLTNTSACISEARANFTDITGVTTGACGVVDPGGQPTCPDDGVRRIIDVSTDGNPTIASGTDCQAGFLDTAGSLACAQNASSVAETAGVNVLNTIAVGAGISQANAESWTFPTPVTVFNSGDPIPPETEGFVVLATDFDDYEPAIASKLFAEVADDPILTILKTITNGPGPFAAGDPINYNIAVGNAGNVELTNVLVTDPTAGTVICPGGNPIPSLGVGVTVDCTASYTVLQSDIDNQGGGDGDIDNTATADSDETDPPVDSSAEAPLVPLNSVIDIDKTGAVNIASTAPSGELNAGDLINYTMVVTNTGNSTLTAITVSDPLPGISAIVCLSSGTATIAALAPTESDTCTATYAVTQADIDAGVRDNTSSADGTAPDGPVNDTDPHSEPLIGRSEIDIDKTGVLDITATAPTDSLNAGDLINYTMVVTNTGQVTLVSITVTDPLLDGAPISCAGNGDATITALAPGEFDTCTADYAVTQDDINTGQRDNTATTDGTDAYGSPVNDSDPHTEPLGQVAMLGIVKTATPQTYSRAGEVIDYSYDLTNTGNVTLYQPFTVDDDLADDESCPGTPSSLAPDEFITCTATYTILDADIIAESVTNTATGQGYDAAEGGDPVVSLPDDETVDLVKVELSKVVETYTDNGDGTFIVTYLVTATNGGGGPASYDIIDTFTPGLGVSLTMATAEFVSGDGPDGANPSSPFSSGGIVVGDETIGDGLTDTWRITGNFTVDPAVATPLTVNCDDDGDEAGNTGTTNTVTGSATDQVDDNMACQPLPLIDLAKTVNGTATLMGDGTYRVEYLVTATNTGAAAGTYNVVDSVDPAPGLSLAADPTMSYVGGETEDTAIGAFPNFLTGEGLTAGGSEVWAVESFWDVDPTADLTAARICTPGTEVVQEGFYNRVDGSATDGVPDNNDACTVLPDPVLDLRKEINTVLPTAADQFTVEYQIYAVNTGDGPALFDVDDVLDPGAGIIPQLPPTVAYVAIDDTFPSPVTVGTWPNISTGETLAGQKSESWTVEVVFDIDRTAGGFESTLLCQSDDGGFIAGAGFYNEVVAVDGEEDTNNNKICQPPELGTIELVKEVVGGDADPEDFWITLTGDDGVHGQGVDYQAGDLPPVQTGVEYTVSEAEGQVDGYVLEEIVCEDDLTGLIQFQPFTVSALQTVVCTVTNVAEEEVIPVPVNRTWALILLTLMMLATGWYFTPNRKKLF